MLTPAGRFARIGSPGCSVELGIRVDPGWLWWGATWSVACGAAAAWPWQPGVYTLARLMAAWLVSVPMLAALRSQLRLARCSSADTRGSRDHGARVAGTLLLAGCAASVGALLGSSEGMLTLGSLMLCALMALRPERLPGAGARDSVLEIIVPGVMAWLALGGPASPPAALAVAEGTGWALSRWMVDNGAAPAVLAAFALVHHGSRVALQRRSLDARWREIVIGYGLAIALLVLEGRVLGASWVALLFAAQWPMQSAMRSGHALRHLRRAQWLAMAAMMVAMASL